MVYMMLFNPFRVRLCFSSPVPRVAFPSGIYPGLNYLSPFGDSRLIPSGYIKKVSTILVLESNLLAKKRDLIKQRD
jgi:hypothetical protein